MRKKQAKAWHRGDRILDASGLHAVVEHVEHDKDPKGKPRVCLTLAWSDGYTTVHCSTVVEGIIRRGGKHIPVARDLPMEHAKTIKHMVEKHPKALASKPKRNVKGKKR